MYSLKLEIFIPVEPKPWTVRKGRSFYNVNSDYIMRVRYAVREMYRKDALDCPIYLDLVHHMPIPKRTSKKKLLEYLQGKIYHLKKPDTTNLNKQMEDCLTGIVWQDDCQVVQIKGKKIYHQEVGTLVKVYEYKEDA